MPDPEPKYDRESDLVLAGAVAFAVWLKNIHLLPSELTRILLRIYIDSGELRDDVEDAKKYALDAEGLRPASASAELHEA